jgi:hypothetical protein
MEAIICAVTCSNVGAVNYTMACLNDTSPALMKPSTKTVVAEEDCTWAVVIVTARSAATRFVS